MARDWAALANKVSALVDRQEPKDLADIYWLCCRDNLDLLTAMEHASGKAAGLFQPIVAKALHDGLGYGVPRVFWQQQPEADAFRKGIEGLIERLVTGGRS